MGFFFTSSGEKLSRLEIDRALGKLGFLEESDKHKIRQMLAKRSGGGITKSDVIEVTRQLKRDRTDDVDEAEAEAARRELLEELEQDE